MEEKEKTSSAKEVKFSSEDLAKLESAKNALAVSQSSISPKSPARTKLSPAERHPTPVNRAQFIAHRDSAPDIDGAKVEAVRSFKQLRDSKSN